MSRRFTVSVLWAGNSVAQNMLLAKTYENKYEISLGKHLKGKCGDKFFMCLSSLLIPKSDFIAQRLEAAMKGACARAA